MRSIKNFDPGYTGIFRDKWDLSRNSTPVIPTDSLQRRAPVPGPRPSSLPCQNVIRRGQPPPLMRHVGAEPGDLAERPSNPDHRTRLARRSRRPSAPPRPARLSSRRVSSRGRRNRPTSNEKTAVSPGAIPECEHPRDWVAVGAVSSEPVSPMIWASARRLLNPRQRRSGPKTGPGSACARANRHPGLSPVDPGKSRDLFFGSRVVCCNASWPEDAGIHISVASPPVRR